ncbi:hypothetical protein F1C16_21800 (plasmid) [Hymenobacter sp. NBH84]|uniref:hypothetical protein n=1 Tax=Hymenobacter sp. NBH84 TaxID=2596915 RepID=UPI00162318B4|nr:hypothetical protein [Hymenobacter sp. NBH84]QNE42263.1 hypothetical protein F1C16_21800 [Hymenobacter sp. NBH84]
MKRLAYLLLNCAALVFSAGCSKDDTIPSGPKEYQVEYKVTSNAAQSDYLSYTNESGGNTTLNNTPLPASYRFKRTLKQGDNLTILASIDGGSASSEITCAILLDGQEVKRETGRGVDAQAVPVYVIGQ